MSRKRAVTTAESGAPTIASQPYSNQRFAVGIEGLQGTRATEVLLPAARIVTASGKRRTVQFEPLIVRRGLTVSSDWYDWWDEARRTARVPKRLVTVVLQNANGAEGMRWLFPDSVPVGYTLSPLNAMVGAAMIESLELRVGGFELYRRS